MRKLFFSIALCLATLSSTYAVVPENTSGTKISFVTLVHSQYDNTGSHQPYPRTPILAPTVYLDDHTLILYTEFEEAIEVQLLDPDTMDDDEPTVVYSVNVPAGTQQVALPDTYTGEYGIRLVVGQWYFVGTVCL